MNAQTLSAINEAAQSWVGTPFHHAARIKGAGVDCANLLIAVYSEAGLIEPFELEPYPQDWMLHREAERFLDTVGRYADEVPVPVPGDTVVMRFGRCFSHGAILVDPQTLVHAFVGRPVEPALFSDYAERPMRYFRVRAQ